MHINLDQEIKHDSDTSMVDDVLMTIDDLAQYLRVKKRTIYDWVKKGKIPAIKTVGQWRFRKEKVDAWLEHQQ
ncbi:MAG: helix-turn-helix domain-containing protein [Candidatus Omnitrophota bacterium]|nr:helix-turn-helix domain-containing protein [Candidatus Omnitrophota bacterium]